jgi:hypothetical protein
MKTQYQIQITTADNGYIIAAASDSPGQNKRLVSTDKAGVVKQLKHLADHIFDEETKSETPEKTDAKPT